MKLRLTVIDSLLHFPAQSTCLLEAIMADNEEVEDVTSEAKVTKDAKKDNAEVDNSKQDKKNGGKDGDDESSDDEEHEGLYDKPVVIEGKRERKTPTFLASQTPPQSMTVPKALVFEGKGETLGSMERTNYELGKSTAVELKPLHKLLFGREGRAPEIKKNIRKFNGFGFEKDSKEYEAKKFNVERFTNDGLKRLCEIFDLEKKGKRSDLQEKVMDFLMSPKSSGRPAPQPKAKKSESKKRKRSSKKDTSKSKKSTKVVSEEEEEEERDEDDDDDDDDDDDEKEIEEEEPPKKIKKTVTTPKKTEPSPKKGKETKAVKEKTKEKDKSKAKSKVKKTDDKTKASKKKEPVAVKITPLKKTSAKKTPKKGKPAPEDDSSDEEPLAKKAKKDAPTNSDLEKIVQDLLDGADLEKVTMKSVCKQVYDMFPDHDLTPRKDFIKETVRKVIA
ncbi:protein DEK-like [Montipora capricornis]|uniref:protein DEK-like n=1 Tax=Montipora capricornis TaxID=246305 RepID=UPI0035F1516E